METWKAVPGWENYDVSSLGRVRSWNRRSKRREEPRLMALRFDSKGYARVTLCHLGKQMERFVHQLVLELFVSSRPPGTEGRHMNGVRNDNRPENLQWATHAENMMDQYVHNTRARGESHGSARLTSGVAIEIYSSKEQCKDIAARLGVSKSVVSNIRHGKAWSHVTSAIDNSGP